MIGDPTITVECDKCGDCDEVGLTPLNRGNWDDRNVRRKLISSGWTIDDDDKTYCTECSEESA